MPHRAASAAASGGSRHADPRGPGEGDHSSPTALDFWAVFESAPDAYLLLAPDAPRFTMLAANEARLRATMTRREERPDGSFEERYWAPLNSPVLDDRGRLLYIIHRVEDVTDQVRTGRRLAALESAAEESSRRLSRETAARAEETKARREIEGLLSKLRESEDRYRLLVDMLPQNIWTTDAAGRHTYFSWHEYTGTTLEEMEGWGWQQVHHPDHVNRVAERIRRAFETGEPWEDTFPLRSKSGECRWFLSRAVPIRDREGKIVRWFGTNTDVTEEIEAGAERERLLERERRAHANAEERREALERVTESRTRLMRGFSHDVKNPLGAADGYAALLEEGIGGGLTETQRQSVQRIRRSIQTSLRLINDLLELARAEAGQIELEVHPLDAAALAREVADDFRGQIDAAGLSLEVRASDPLPVESDATRVRQILSNLVSNAAKYTREGRITIDACRRTRPDAPRPDEWAAITVADTGPGIPVDQRERIFQEFTRLDPDAPHGAGVGLAISRRIACLLGGDVTVQSEAGRGSTFTLWLRPANRALL